MISTAALVLPFSFVATSSGAHAGAAKIDVSGATVSCATVVGTLGSAPPLTASTGGNIIKLKGTIDGCTVSGAPSPVKLLPSIFTAVLTGPGGGFGAINGLSTVTGSIKIVWKADPTTPLLQTQTILTPNQTCGGLYLPAAPLAGAYGEFHIGAQASCQGGAAQAAPSATGAFVGGPDAGASTVVDAVTGEDVQALTNAALGKGIKSIHIGQGNLSLG